jgi:hypothetical protein
MGQGNIGYVCQVRIMSKREGIMTIDPIEGADQHRDAEERWNSQILELANTWEHPIRQSLTRLGQELWPPKYILGIVPVSSYRLRSYQPDPGTFIWWIEHDISYNGQECAAYQVQLKISAQGPAIIVQSGDSIYEVSPLTAETLEMMVVEAGRDAPLLIPTIKKEVND